MLEMITIADGRIKVEGLYEGPIMVFIPEEFYAPDIFVEFDQRKYVGDDGHPCDNEKFAQSVIDFLVEQGVLDSGHKYEMHRAELGMQGSGSVAYETLLRDEEDINRELYAKYDTRDLSAEEEEEARLHEIEMEKLMTPELRKLLKDRQKLFLDYVRRLKLSLLGPYAHFSGEFQVYKHEVLGSEWQKMENEDLKRHVERLFLQDIRKEVSFNSFGNHTWGFYLADGKDDDEEFFE